ncbi:hypothetical protein Pla110_32730 [Polystyrenella longa]|uniref:Uncharacterized protein n=1 Tax=Polystyrenella longa TaxID=2528007 RepID=A0A518CQN0_9PLAN|nr:hypothetical protein [Polystyrenella longa]QDU81531.1 hypothetical protein Pla110_32730 [Polystyrenella longa]
MFSSLLKKNDKSVAIEDETDVQLAEKKSIGSRIKGWFDKDEDELQSADDPLFAEYEFSDVDPDTVGATQESNGAVSLTSADEEEGNNIRKASSILDRDLDQFMRSDKLKIDEGQYSNLDGEKIGLPETSTIEKQMASLKQDSVQNFDSSFDEAMARIGAEVEKEQKESEEELNSMRADFEKIAAMQNEEKAVIKEKVASNSGSSKKESDSLQFGSFDSSNPFETKANQNIETASFGQEEDSFRSKFESFKESEAFESVASDDWVQEQIKEETSDDGFDTASSEAWLPEEDVKNTFEVESADAGVKSSKAGQNKEWIDSQPVAPNPAYQQESGRMIFDSKSVPSRFMSPEEKENWFRQTKLERAGKKNTLPGSEGLDDNGSDPVIQTVAGFELEAKTSAFESPAFESPALELPPSTSFNPESTFEFVPRTELTVQTGQAPQTAPVKLGLPEWGNEERDSEKGIEEFVTDAVATDDVSIPAFAVATVVGPSIQKPIFEMQSPEFAMTNGFESGPEMEANGKVASSGDLPNIEWGDEAESESIVVNIPEMPEATVSTTQLPGRWLGIVLSLGTICYLIIRRRTPAAAGNPSTAE